MKKLMFCDIDGVVRSLSQSVVYERLRIKDHNPKEWFWKLENKDIYQLVAEDFTVLSRCVPTKYYPIIHKFSHKNTITFLSCQPEKWIPHTNVWMKRYFPDSKIMYFETSREKLNYFQCVLQSGVDGYLIEDYPFKGLPEYVMNRIILISYPYNREVSGYHHKVKNLKQLESVLKKYNGG